MIKLTATGKRLTATPDQPITSGSVGLTATLTTEAAWDGLTVTVVFRVGATEMISTVEDGAYIVPWELLSADNIGKRLQIGVCGTRGADYVYPTVYTDVGLIVAGANPNADPGATPTPSAYQEILTAANAAEHIAQSVRDDADAGLFRGNVGDTGPQGEQGLQGLKGDTGATGSSISSILRTSGDGSPGTTDTYTITMTDGATSTFQVYNGAEQDISGKVDRVPATNLLTNGDFSNGTDGWATVFGTGGVADNTYTLTLSGSQHRGGVLPSSNLSPFPTAGEKYYFRALARVTSDDAASIAIEIYKTGRNQSVQSISNPAKDTWHTLSGVVTIPEAIGPLAKLSVYVYYASKEIAAGKTMDVKHCFCCNLTATFGAGNEPSADEMDRILEMFPNSWFDGTVDLTSVIKLYTLIGNNKITVDSALSSLSTNPVQNSVIKASLDNKADLVDGLIPGAQLPSYVDDVIEASNFAALPATGEAGKIYVTTNDNKTWRWSGSSYVEISASIALGETSSTAYRGDRGKTAYDHSQTSGNPHGTTAANINITDTGTYFATDTVETALQQIGAELDGLSAALEGLL